MQSWISIQKCIQLRRETTSFSILFDYFLFLISGKDKRITSVDNLCHKKNVLFNGLLHVKFSSGFHRKILFFRKRLHIFFIITISSFYKDKYYFLTDFEEIMCRKELNSFVAFAYNNHCSDKHFDFSNLFTQLENLTNTFLRYPVIHFSLF